MQKETYFQTFMEGKEHLAMLVTNLRDIELPDFIALDKDENVILVAEVTDLIEAWLSDLKYYWMSNSPAYLKELQTIGFLALIEGGTQAFVF